MDGERICMELMDLDVPEGKGQGEELPPLKEMSVQEKKKESPSKPSPPAEKTVGIPKELGPSEPHEKSIVIVPDTGTKAVLKPMDQREQVRSAIKEQPSGLKPLIEPSQPEEGGLKLPPGIREEGRPAGVKEVSKVLPEPQKSAPGLSTSPAPLKLKTMQPPLEKVSKGLPTEKAARGGVQEGAGEVEKDVDTKLLEIYKTFYQ
jgi:hypothetical protein